MPCILGNGLTFNAIEHVENVLNLKREVIFFYCIYPCCAAPDSVLVLECALDLHIYLWALVV